jgi:hypothetical protein
MGTTINGDTGVIFPDASTQSKVVSQATPFAVTASAIAGAELQLPEATANGVNYVAIKAANTLAANTTFTLPAADGTNGQFLQTNGSGALAFATVAPGGTTGQIQFNNAGVFGGVTAVGVANGGTGATTLTANAVLIGNGTSAVSAVAPGTTGNILTSNGTSWTSAAAPAAGLQGVMVVLTSGTSYTIPAGVTRIKATVVGGGGGLSSSFPSGTGGGGGGTAIRYFTVTPGSTITYAVGALGGTGSNGGDSSVTVGGTTITGGGGTVSSSSASTFSAGGTATNGDLNIQGSGGGGTGQLSIGGGSLFGTGSRVNSVSSTTPSVGYGGGASYISTGVVPGSTAGVVIIEY